MPLADKYYLIPKTYGNDIAKALKAKGIESPFMGADFVKKIYQLPTLETFYHTEIPYDEEKAGQIADTAQSYLDAIADGRLVIVYQAGYSTLSGENQVLRNENGVYVIQCSAFVGLVLRGISYENSPFYDGDGSKVNARTDLFPWANTDYEKGGYTEANQLAQYAFQTGCILNSNDLKNAKKGDLLFFEKYDSAYFGSIWHIAMVMEHGATKVVHAMQGKSTGVWTFDMNNPPSNIGKLKYIARPRYNVDFSEKLDDNTLKIISHPVDQFGSAGEMAIFKVVAQGEGLSYKWQYLTNGTGWYQSGFDGWDTDTQPVEIQSWRNGHMYRCEVTDKHGNTVISNPAQIIMI